MSAAYAGQSPIDTSETIFSFIVDRDPVFLYSGWHLARSLIAHCGGAPSSIIVQCTPEVPEHDRLPFREMGCRVVTVERFGDGRYCNKINQLANLAGLSFKRAVLLDTDMIAVADVRPFLRDDAIVGKVVDGENPPLDALSEIAASACLRTRPGLVPTDDGTGETFLGNCNGGFYSIPHALVDRLSEAWRHWALWLLDNDAPLRRTNHHPHVDQVSFCLAIWHAGLPFALAPANVNYYTHMQGAHGYFDPTRPLALLHYHTTHLDVLGRIVAAPDANPAAEQAIAAANRQIGDGFDNRAFWNFRYRHFFERGSGVGSRGDNLAYKRQLLIDQGIERAASVLDVGCGDLEVLKPLRISNYVGVDSSAMAIDIARRARPDWQFHHGSPADAEPADMVLCFEVLIHQESADKFDRLIEIMAAKAQRTLIVSGYDAGTEAINGNPMVFFHRPLADSIARTGRFASIQEIGRHSDVVIYRCDV